METPDKEFQQQARHYFLSQGQSIEKLHEMLNAHLLVFHFKKGLSLFLQFLLYILFIVMVLLILFISSNDIGRYLLSPQRGLSVDIILVDPDVLNMIMGLKVLLILSSLPLLFLAGMLSRSYKKSSLIRKSFLEVVKMRQAFDRAARDLRL